jgi:hypothetical protein
MDQAGRGPPDLSSDDLDVVPVYYLHLDRARVIDQQSFRPIGPEILWRVPLSKVDGFFLGVVSEAA